MEKLPELLVVTDRGHFNAYQGHQDGRLTPLDTMENAEALEKLSDQVTDKAGGFPAAESYGQGNSSAERLPLETELQMRAIRRIGQRTQELFDEYECSTWGLIASPEINRAILDQLPEPMRDKLVVNVKRNLTGQSTEELKQRLVEA